MSKISMLSAVTRWQHGTTNDNEFVGEMADCKCQSISSTDDAKKFSQINKYGSEVIFEVLRNVVPNSFGYVVLLQGYFDRDEEQNQTATCAWCRREGIEVSDTGNMMEHHNYQNEQCDGGGESDDLHNRIHDSRAQNDAARKRLSKN